MLTWILNILSLWVVDGLMDSVYFVSFSAIAFTALLLTILNATVKPILKFLTFSISFITFGLFSLVINAIVLNLAIHLSSGSYIASFGMAIVAGVILSVVNSVLGAFKE